MKNKKEVVGLTRRILFRIYLKLRNVLNPKSPLSQEELYCSQICLTLIGDPESHLTMSPISQKRFIINSEKDIFIIIHNRLVTIINHVYGYNMIIEDNELYGSVIKKFDLVLEKKRQDLEDDMKKNIQTSLKSILQKVKDSPSIHE